MRRPSMEVERERVTELRAWANSRINHTIGSIEPTVVQERATLWVVLGILDGDLVTLDSKAGT